MLRYLFIDFMKISIPYNVLTLFHLSTEFLKNVFFLVEQTDDSILIKLNMTRYFKNMKKSTEVRKLSQLIKWLLIFINLLSYQLINFFFLIFQLPLYCGEVELPPHSAVWFLAIFLISSATLSNFISLGGPALPKGNNNVLQCFVL